MVFLHEDLKLQLGDPFIAVVRIPLSAAILTWHMHLQTKSFKMYSSFANNFDNSSHILDKYEKTELYKAFKRVSLYLCRLIEYADTNSKNLEPKAAELKCKAELRSLLIMPIQRIPRYILLLKVN